MIDLQFGKYGIKTADRLNIVLYELVENKKEGSKNYGAVSQKILGYYSNLEFALNAYVKVALADDDFNATNVEEVITAIGTIQHRIKHECDRLMLKWNMLKGGADNG